jgi:hypothetical protein
VAIGGTGVSLGVGVGVGVGVELATGVVVCAGGSVGGVVVTVGD